MTKIEKIGISSKRDYRNPDEMIDTLIELADKINELVDVVNKLSPEPCEECKAKRNHFDFCSKYKRK